MASMIQVFQLKHPNTGEPVSPVVNVGSIFDKKGQKVDNLLSYRIVGTDLTIPQFHDIQGDLDNRLTTIDNRLNNLDNEINNKITTKVNALNGTMDAATLGGSTKSQIISSARYTHPTTKQCSYSYVHPESQQCSNVDAATLGGKTLSEVIENVKSSAGGSGLKLVKTVSSFSGELRNSSSDITSYSDYRLILVGYYNGMMNRSAGLSIGSDAYFKPNRSPGDQFKYVYYGGVSNGVDLVVIPGKGVTIVYSYSSSAGSVGTAHTVNEMFVAFGDTTSICLDDSYNGASAYAYLYK